VTGVAGDLLEYRAGRLGGLALADQEAHQTALSDGAGGEASRGCYEPRLGVLVVNVVIDDERRCAPVRSRGARRARGV
jgi:hypothetical protein